MSLCERAGGVGGGEVEREGRGGRGGGRGGERGEGGHLKGRGLGELGPGLAVKAQGGQRGSSRVLSTGSRHNSNNRALIGSIYPFPWCKYSCHG